MFSVIPCQFPGFNSIVHSSTPIIKSAVGSKVVRPGASTCTLTTNVVAAALPALSNDLSVPVAMTLLVAVCTLEAVQTHWSPVPSLRAVVPSVVVHVAEFAVCRLQVVPPS